MSLSLACAVSRWLREQKPLRDHLDYETIFLGLGRSFRCVLRAQLRWLSSLYSRGHCLPERNRSISRLVSVLKSKQNIWKGAIGFFTEPRNFISRWVARC